MVATRRSPWTIPLAQGPVSSTADRVTATIVGVVAVGLTAVLRTATADGRGHGTHEQFGMDACGWPQIYGIPCPTCGCTTAATQIVHGDVLGAFVTQPFGAVIALFGLGVGIHAVMCLLRGRSFVDLVVRLPFWKIIFLLFLLLLASWGYKYLVWAE